MKKKWTRVTICLSEEEREALRLLACLRGESSSKYIRYLITNNLNASQIIVDIMKEKGIFTPASESQT